MAGSSDGNGDDKGQRGNEVPGVSWDALLHELARTDPALEWQMSPSEQAMILYLLEHLRPAVAIEIGTRFGGSLQILARHCGRVYSLDMDAGVTQRLGGRFPNVEYLIGRSDETLPALLGRLQQQDAPLEFVLVDGDHTTEGVRADVNSLLKFRPTRRLCIVMHDSFNPGVRRGLKAADWPSCPYVHRIELDLVAGGVNTHPQFRGQLWGGLAMAMLAPQPRSGDLVITAGSQLTYEAASKVFSPGLVRKAVRKIAHLGGNLARG